MSVVGCSVVCVCYLLFDVRCVLFVVCCLVLEVWCCLCFGSRCALSLLVEHRVILGVRCLLCVVEYC